MLTAIIEHTLLGGLFACTGAGVKCLCPRCRWKQIAIGASMVFAEAVVMVVTIG